MLKMRVNRVTMMAAPNAVACEASGCKKSSNCTSITAQFLQRGPLWVVAANATVTVGSNRKETFQFSGPSDIQR